MSRVHFNELVGLHDGLQAGAFRGRWCVAAGGELAGQTWGPQEEVRCAAGVRPVGGCALLHLKAAAVDATCCCSHMQQGTSSTCTAYPHMLCSCWWTAKQYMLLLLLLSYDQSNCTRCIMHLQELLKPNSNTATQLSVNSNCRLHTCCLWRCLLSCKPGSSLHWFMPMLPF